jgi:acyl-coenzyme A synthetase/AMP-(fatty) acid ligase
MKSLLLGGEALPAPLYQRMRELGIQARIINGYGPTETTIFITCDNVTDEHITIGGPVGNTKLAIFDKFHNELPPYVPGALILCGDNVGRGYVKLEQMNKEKYISFEGLPAYRSGDLSRWSPDGRILFMGRMDNQVKLRGLRIELDEIENVMNTYPGMMRSLVLVKENQREGQFLCAYFTANRRVDPNALKAHISKSLAKYMVPSVYISSESSFSSSRRNASPLGLRFSTYCVLVILRFTFFFMAFARSEMEMVSGIRISLIFSSSFTTFCFSGMMNG